MEFPQVKGKKLEALEFSTRADNHSVHLLFSDKTALNLVLEPGFTLFADFADWKTGNRRLIRRWKPFRSRMFRE